MDEFRKETHMSRSEHHPARSPEFLSRLHDGDLDPGERARFEAHRAHCAECREAAAQLEEALAFFRSSRPRPPAPDLPARILRRLRAASPRRSLPGQAFGIDLKWAGAFAAALVAVIVGSAVIVERERRERQILREESIPLVIEQRTAAPPPRAEEPKRAQPADALASMSRKRVAAMRAAPPAGSEKEKVAEKPAFAGQNRLAGAPPADVAFAPAPGAPAPPPPSSPAARADEQARRKILDKTAELEERGATVASRQRSDLQGGEGGQQSVAGAVAQEPAIAVRIRVIAPDGQGSAPEPANAAELSLSAADRGEYVVVVRSDGSVASVRASAAARDERKLEKSRESRRPAFDELRKLRFAPAGRPRHLILRIE